MRLRYRGQDVYARARAQGWAVCPRDELRTTEGGVTVGAYPDGLVTVEGRLAALLHGEDDHRLLGPDDLVRAPELVAERFGLEAGRRVGVGRADLTSELVFGDAAEGLELLRAASYVDVPWLKCGTEGSKRTGLETVYWRSMRGRSVVLRLYDKGVETGQAGPGTWLRLERQRRYRKAREPGVDDLVQGLARAFVGRELAGLVSGVEDVHVCDRDGAVQALRLAYGRGELSASALQRLAGWIVAEMPGALPAWTERRYAAELRRLGIALNPNEGGRSVVPVGAYLRAFAERWAA